MLRCAQHAPELKDKSTGETRQLMEGDVVSRSGQLHKMVVFKYDGLRFRYCTGAEQQDLMSTDNADNILGNALTNPELLDDWKLDNLPKWELLREIVAAHRAAKVSPEVATLIEELQVIKESIGENFQDNSRNMEASILRIEEIQDKLKEITT
jgi:hypothetical protein